VGVARAGKTQEPNAVVPNTSVNLRYSGCGSQVNFAKIRGSTRTKAKENWRNPGETKKTGETPEKQGKREEAGRTQVNVYQ
jgi:hypothetical protein